MAHVGRQGKDQTGSDSKILIYDELDFSHFYEPIPQTKIVLDFVQLIKADIFVPIYDKDKLIAYIIVDRFARLDQFYKDIEYDEWRVFHFERGERFEEKIFYSEDEACLNMFEKLKHQQDIIRKYNLKY